MRCRMPPLNPVTPYDPSVAALTMSMTARFVTSDRPGMGSLGTPATSSSWGRCRPSGASEAVCYHTAPFGPSWAFTLVHHTPRTTHGPLLRDLRQGVDGRVQPAVVGHEPRPRASPLQAEPAAARHRAEGHARQGARLHALPAHPAQELPLGPGSALRQPPTTRNEARTAANTSTIAAYPPTARPAA